MTELRALLPVAVRDGAALLGDGSAVGLVVGGLARWELQPPEVRAAAVRAYHQALLALEAPVHQYRLDLPLTLDDDEAAARQRLQQTTQPVLRAVLQMMVTRLQRLEALSLPRTRATVWVLPVAPVVAVAVPTPWRRRRGGEAPRGEALLQQAQQRARQWADLLPLLARPATAAEIAVIWYMLADVVRGLAYAVPDDLLQRAGRLPAAATPVVEGETHVLAAGPA